MRMNLLSAFVTLLIAVASHGAADTNAVVVKEACPFECCQYGSWKTNLPTVVYESPAVAAREIDRLSLGDPIEALTGETHTIPGRFVFDFDHGVYKRGDVIELHSYLGEGHFLVQNGGKRAEQDLGFSPYGQQPKDPCVDENRCFGHLERPMEMTWWVRIRMPNGHTGWIRNPKKFSGSDACAS